MSTSDANTNELKEISPLLSTIGRAQPYTYPQDYFDGLPDLILEKIQVPEILSGIKTQVFAAPTGYFEGLADEIFTKIKMDVAQASNYNEDELPLVLQKIGRKMPYSVPAHYFETLNVSTEQPAAVVPLYSKTKTKWINRAAAAVIAGVLAVGGYFFATDNTAGPVAKPLYSLNIANQVNGLSSDEIIDYLQTYSTPAEGLTSSKAPVKELTLDDYLNKITEEDIKQYLKEYEEPVNSERSGS